jgi:hypothetical protein
MAYFSSTSALQNRYGVDNIKLWADMDGSGSASAIAARIAVALGYADAWVWGKMFRTEYQSVLGTISAPTIVDSYGNVPSLLNMAATMWAGYYLLSARGFRDFDKDGKPLNRLAADLMLAEQTMKDIQEKTLSIDCLGVNV